MHRNTERGTRYQWGNMNHVDEEVSSQWRVIGRSGRKSNDLLDAKENISTDVSLESLRCVQVDGVH